MTLAALSSSVRDNIQLIPAPRMYPTLSSVLGSSELRKLNCELVGSVVRDREPQSVNAKVVNGMIIEMFMLPSGVKLFASGPTDNSAVPLSVCFTEADRATLYVKALDGKPTIDLKSVRVLEHFDGTVLEKYYGNFVVQDIACQSEISDGKVVSTIRKSR